MDYKNELARIAEVHREAIANDLMKARDDLRQAESEVVQRQNTVAVLSYLSRLTQNRPIEAPKTMTLQDAMTTVLRSTPDQMLRPREIADRINELGLYRMRDGRPVETQQIHARTGNYSHMFEKRGSFIKLVEDQQ